MPKGWANLLRVIYIFLVFASVLLLPLEQPLGTRSKLVLDIRQGTKIAWKECPCEQ